MDESHTVPVVRELLVQTHKHGYDMRYVTGVCPESALARMGDQGRTGFKSGS